MTALSLSMGTRATSRVPLVDPTTGATLTGDDGPAWVEIRWPDHSAVVRDRAVWLATQAQYERDVLTPDGKELRPDIAPERAGDIVAAQDASFRHYAAALVCGWSLSDALTRENVLALFEMAPFVPGLIVTASAEHERFLPPSLRSAPSTPAPLSEGPSA